jgi:fatty acid desaturase
MSTLVKANHKKGFASSCLVAIIHISLMVVAMFVGVLSIRMGGYFIFIFCPIVIVFVGTRFRAINNMSHECCHGAYAESKKINEIFGYIFSILELSSFNRVRAEHRTHHRYLGCYKKDLDFEGLDVFKFHEKITRETVIFHCINAFRMKFIKKYFFVVLWDDSDIVWAKFGRVFYLLVLFSSFILYPLEFFVVCIFPFITIYQIHKYLMDYLDHGGKLLAENEIDKTRNFIVKNWIIRKLFFPRIDCYHLVHHLFPFISVESLPQAHLILLKHLPEYDNFVHEGFQQAAEWFDLE